MDPVKGPLSLLLFAEEQPWQTVRDCSQVTSLSLSKRHCYAGEVLVTKCKLIQAIGDFLSFFFLHAPTFQLGGYLGNKFFCACSLYELFMAAMNSTKAGKKENGNLFLTQRWTEIFSKTTGPFYIFIYNITGIAGKVRT